MQDSTNSPTETAFEAIRRVAQPIEPEWPGGMRFFVSPPMLFLFMLLTTVFGFLVMFGRFRAHYYGGF